MPFATEDNITSLAVARWATARDPRLRQIMTALVKHAHAFVREIEPTHGEWLAAMEYLAATGQKSDDKRKEFILLSDVLAISMLTVMINGRKPTGATPDTVLGPFHIDHSPLMKHDENMAEGIGGEPMYISGTVRGLDGGPLAGALLDIWQADGDGAYESQIPDAQARLRALQYTDADGHYGFWTIAPKGYAIPMDGPVGALIDKTDISYFRPAHIHFLVSAPGHLPVVTHLFRQGAEFIDTDVVFGTRQELIVPFIRHDIGIAPDGKMSQTPYYTIDYEFVLVRDQAGQYAQPADATEEAV